MTVTVLWQRLDVPGLEHCHVVDGPDGVGLHGSVIVAEDGAPLRVEYEVVCSPAWVTRRALVTVRDGEAVRRLELTADDRRRWWVNGREIEALAGCADVDLSLSPGTNALPVRRLGLLDLPAGESREATAAWVGFPELSVEPLAQRYTGLGGGRFRYEAASGFVTELELDERGLVVAYPPLWRRVAIRR
ncbi:MAG: putative glycolipid-binding domain-containing protein [Candidatus Rokuibacteriota bacterium]